MEPDEGPLATDYTGGGDQVAEVGPAFSEAAPAEGTVDDSSWAGPAGDGGGGGEDGGEGYGATGDGTDDANMWSTNIQPDTGLAAEPGAATGMSATTSSAQPLDTTAWLQARADLTLEDVAGARASRAASTVSAGTKSARTAGTGGGGSGGGGDGGQIAAWLEAVPATAAPADPVEWVSAFDPNTKHAYYYNVHTGATTWVEPAVYKPADAVPSIWAVMRAQRMLRAWLARRAIRKMREAVQLSGMDAREYNYVHNFSDRPPRTCLICQTNQTECISFPCKHDTMCVSCYQTAPDENGRVFCPECFGVVDGICDQRDAEGLKRWDEYMGKDEWKEVQEESAFVRAMGDWDAYTHLASGQLYYVHRVSGESSWEAPVDSIAAVKSYLDDPYGENLGADFENTKWVPPSIEKAETYKASNIFAGGTGPVWGTTHEDIASLGVGIALYFSLLRYLVVAFAVCSLVSTPVFMFYGSGSRVPASAPNVLGLGSLTLGNAAWQDPELPKVVVPADATVYWGPVATTATQASYMVMLCDWAYSVFLILFVLFITRRLDSVIKQALSKHVSSADYTVYVSHLPLVCSPAAVLQHFTNLFAPTSLLVAGRKVPSTSQIFPSPLAATSRTLLTPTSAGGQVSSSSKTLGKSDGNVAKVSSVDHNGRAEFLDSWIADVSMAYADGGQIRTYLAAQHVAEKLRHARAKTKMLLWKKETGDKRAGKRAKKALDEVIRLGFRLDEVRQKTLYERTNVVGAFVTFNHEESYMKALEAYSGSQHWFGRWRQHQDLRFGPEREAISVVASKDPSDVLWQNLEVNARERWCRRQVTFIATIILVAISFAIIVYASAEQQNFAKQLPQLEQCDKQLPALALGGYENATAEIELASAEHPEVLSHVQLTRPSVYLQSQYDTTCRTVRKDATAFDVRVDYLNITYNDLACASNPDHLPPDWPFASPDAACPVPYATSQCPCVLPSTSGSCFTVECYSDYNSPHCAPFPASTIAGCYCLRALQSLINEKGTISGSREFLNTQKDVCLDFGKAYFSAQGLVAVAALSVSIVNILLKIAIDMLAEYERHHSVSGETGAATLKIFLAQFVNTGLVALVANAKPPDALSFILNGQHSGMDASWYWLVGGPISLTVLVNTFVPHLVPIVNGLILRPFGQWRARRQAKASSTYFVMQKQMNDAFVGETFSIKDRYPQILTMFFVPLLYSGGLPILLVFGLAFFILTYWIDKYLILRYYRIPPAYDASLAQQAVSLLPLAIILHLLFSIWMYSEANVTASDYASGVPSVSSAFSLSSRLSRWNTLPLAATCFLFVAALVLSFLWRTTITAAIARYGRSSFDRKFLAPFTEDFGKLLELPRARTGAGKGSTLVAASMLARPDADKPAGAFILDAQRKRSVAAALAVGGGLPVKPQPLPEHARRRSVVDADGGEFRHEKRVLCCTVVESRITLTRLQRAQGWRIEVQSTGLPTLRKVWTAARTVNGTRREKGSQKKTWEVIGDGGLYTFDINRNPTYTVAMLARGENAVGPTRKADNDSKSRDGETVEDASEA